MCTCELKKKQQTNKVIVVFRIPFINCAAGGKGGEGEGVPWPFGSPDDL